MQPLCAAGSAPATPKVKGVGDTGRGHKNGTPWLLGVPSCFALALLYASHSLLWASHHVGNFGSFGDRVGVTVSVFNIVELVPPSKAANKE